jgi:hypothetical protein
MQDFKEGDRAVSVSRDSEFLKEGGRIVGATFRVKVYEVRRSPKGNLRWYLVDRVGQGRLVTCKGARDAKPDKLALAMGRNHALRLGVPFVLSIAHNVSIRPDRFARTLDADLV